MEIDRTKYDVVIAGAGPAGTSTAIHLIKQGFKVLLIEQKSFPRDKLCGEFVSPECLDHFKLLGVTPEILELGPAQIARTVFYARSGRHVTVPSSWLGGAAALGISRVAMDQALLQRARNLGASVSEGTTITNVLEDRGRVVGIRIKDKNQEQEILADVTVDATGRSRVLTRKLKSARVNTKNRANLVAFKAHFTGSRLATSSCELYSYPKGYGGLSQIEGNVSNLCFIVDATDVRKLKSDPECVMRETLLRNKRAQFTLKTANRCSSWLSVSLESFGTRDPSPAAGLLAVGDAAAFIDPFTGSGMLMAFESGQLLAETLVRSMNKSTNMEELGRAYAKAHYQKFASRLRVSGLLRRTAYRAYLAEACIAVLSVSDELRSHIARRTRSPRGVLRPVK